LKRLQFLTRFSAAVGALVAASRLVAGVADPGSRPSKGSPTQTGSDEFFRPAARSVRRGAVDSR